MAESHFSETGSKHRCFWSLNQTFALWSSTTPLMQQLLVEKGLMIGVLLELEAFRNCPSSEVCTCNACMHARSLVPRLSKGGGGKESLVHTVCTCVKLCTRLARAMTFYDVLVTFDRVLTSALIDF